MSPSIKQLAGRTLPNSGTKFKVSAKGEVRLRLNNYHLNITEGDLLTFNWKPGDHTYGNYLRVIHDKTQEALSVAVTSDLFDEITPPQKERE